MPTLQQLTVAEVKQRINQSNVVIVDIRDAAVYQQGHLFNAQHLSNANLVEFFQHTDKSSIVIVYCYHGISSQSAAQFLLDEGFSEVYSMIGGFAAWLQNYPNETESI